MWPGAAVANDAVGVGKLGEQAERLLLEGVLGAVASAVQPPHLPSRRLVGEHVKHRHHGRRPDPGTHKPHSVIARTQHEGAARRTRLEDVLDVERGV